MFHFSTEILPGDVTMEGSCLDNSPLKDSLTPVPPPGLTIYKMGQVHNFFHLVPFILLFNLFLLLTSAYLFT